MDLKLLSLRAREKAESRRVSPYAVWDSASQNKTGLLVVEVWGGEGGF